MKKRIKEAIKSLGIEEKGVYTIGELEAIARKSNVSMLDVMRYLRFGR